eukprot:SAG11_NODE_1436_length_4909_cov_3.825780_6_plen_122_part_00
MQGWRATRAWRSCTRPINQLEPSIGCGVISSIKTAAVSGPSTHSQSSSTVIISWKFFLYCACGNSSSKSRSSSASVCLSTIDELQAQRTSLQDIAALATADKAQLSCSKPGLTSAFGTQPP